MAVVLFLRLRSGPENKGLKPKMVVPRVAVLMGVVVPIYSANIS